MLSFARMCLYKGGVLSYERIQRYVYIYIYIYIYTLGIAKENGHVESDYALSKKTILFIQY